MQYDFTTVVPRSGMGSGKWLGMKKKNPNVGEDIVPFSVADMEFKCAPEITEGLKAALDGMIFGYTGPTDSYFEAVKGWMNRRHDWLIHPDWIAMTSGVVTALYHAILAYTEPGDGVLLMTPAYYPMYSAIEQTGRKLVDIPLIEQNGYYTMDFDLLEQRAKDPHTTLILFCSPHNPVGRVWSREELIQMGNICLANDVKIVSDEIHFDLILPGHKHTVLANISEEFAQNTVTCTAPSKTFNLAGMGCSNIIIPNEEMRQKFFDSLAAVGTHSRLHALGYQAVALAYNQCEQWLEELLTVLEQNRLTVLNFFADQLPEVRVFPLEGTYLQWLDCNALGIEYHELERILTQEAQVFLDEGYLFGTAGAGFERIALACPNTVLEKGLIRMKDALIAHRR